jgi:hypothetical protein
LAVLLLALLQWHKKGSDNVAFSKKTWVVGDVITADLLNRLEQALSDHDVNLGDLTGLTTTSKGNIIQAINEIKGIIPLGGGSGSILVYNTLTDLQTAYPSGTTQPVWVVADQEWYYWSGTLDTTAPTVTVSPAAGTYNANQSVTLTANETATIYYTLDGSTPTTSSTVYSGPISIAATTTIKYIAMDTAGNSSAVQSISYTIDTTAPVITASSSGGTFTSSQTVTLSSNETGTTIYYTLDGSTPTTSSPVYNSALTISSTSTLKFLGKDTAGNQSAVQSVSFTINAPDTTAPTVSISPVAGTFTATQSVTMTANEPATIYYTTDGSTPTTSSTVYSGPIAVNQTTTIKYFAKDTAGNQNVVQTATYTINLPDTTAPQPISGLTAGTVTSNSIPVSWTLSPSNDVANYEVAYSSDGGNQFTVASALVNASSTSYTVNGLNSSTAYVIRVVAIDGAGNRSTPVTVNATTSAAADTTPPTVTASPAGGTYFATQTVTLSTEAGATIYYTTDGSTPTYPVSGTTQTYSVPISVSATTTLKYIGRDTAGNVSTVQTQTYTISPSIVSDDFNRADNSTTLGSAWTVANISGTGATYGISGNQAYCVVPGTDSVAYMESGQSDNISISVDLVAVKAQVTRLAWRVQDATHLYILQLATSANAMDIYKRNGSSWAAIQTNIPATGLANGCTVKVQLSGSTHNVYVNGNLVKTFIDTDYQTATKHGISCANSDAGYSRWDNFKVV